MTKICGCITTGDDQELILERLHSMVGVMKHNPEAQEEYVNFEQGAIALIKNSSTDKSRLVAESKRSSCLALCGHVVGLEGHIVSPYRNVPRDELRGSREDDIGVLLHALEHRYEDTLKRLNGVFSLAYHNSTTGALAIANDRYGYMPLYYYYGKNMFLFASEVKAILRVVGQQEFDWESFADFFYLGHMLGQKTLFRNICALGPGQSLTYRNGNLQQSEYHDFTETPVLDREEVSTEKIASLFTEAVRRRVREDEPNTVLLSGGLDSRLILFVLHSLGVTPRVVILEHADEGSADGRFASQVARYLGLDYELRRTRQDFYSSKDWLEVFYILDGMVPNWRLFISQVYPELDSSLGTVWDGLALDNGLGGQHLRKQNRKSWQRFNEKLYRTRARYRPLLKAILTPEAFHAIDDNFMQRVQDEAEQIPASENQFLHFYIKHRSRRRTAVNPYQLYASRVQPITPGTDIDFLDYVLGIPPDLRHNYRIYLDVVRQKFPSITKIPIVSAGERLELNRNYDRRSTPLERSVRRYKKRQIKRLRKKWEDIVHRPSVREKRDVSRLMIPILERKHFDRPLYNKRVLSHQFAAYRKGSSNPQDLFKVLFYIELWHLLFVDKDSSTLSDLQPSHPPQRLL